MHCTKAPHLIPIEASLSRNKSYFLPWISALSIKGSPSGTSLNINKAQLETPFSYCSLISWQTSSTLSVWSNVFLYLILVSQYLEILIHLVLCHNDIIEILPCLIQLSSDNQIIFILNSQEKHIYEKDLMWFWSPCVKIWYIMYVCYNYYHFKKR